HFFCFKIPPLPCFDPVEGDIHDPDTFQLPHMITQCITHPPDLAIEALDEDYPETFRSCLFNETFFGYSIEYGYSIRHGSNKPGFNWLVDRYQVFLLMIVSCTQNLIDDITIIRQKNKSF